MKGLDCAVNFFMSIAMVEVIGTIYLPAEAHLSVHIVSLGVMDCAHVRFSGDSFVSPLHFYHKFLFFAAASVLLYLD